MVWRLPRQAVGEHLSLPISNPRERVRSSRRCLGRGALQRFPADVGGAGLLVGPRAAAQASCARRARDRRPWARTLRDRGAPAVHRWNAVATPRAEPAADPCSQSPRRGRRVCGLDRRWATSTVARPGAEGRAEAQRQRRDRATVRGRVAICLLFPSGGSGGIARRVRAQAITRGGRATTTSRTRANEDVRVTVTRCEPPGVLEEHQEGRIFSRDVVHSLTPSALGTSVRVDDEVIFKGNGRWRRRWPRVTSGSGARPR